MLNDAGGVEAVSGVRRALQSLWSIDRFFDEHSYEGQPTRDGLLADGLATRIWPVQRVIKRYKNGAEDGIAAYGAALGLDVGEPPTPPQRRRSFGRRH